MQLSAALRPKYPHSGGGCSLTRRPHSKCHKKMHWMTIDLITSTQKRKRWLTMYCRKGYTADNAQSLCPFHQNFKKTKWLFGLLNRYRTNLPISHRVSIRKLLGAMQAEDLRVLFPKNIRYKIMQYASCKFHSRHTVQLMIWNGWKKITTRS